MCVCTFSGGQMSGVLQIMNAGQVGVKSRNAKMVNIGVM
jgi:hypothetical protein